LQRCLCELGFDMLTIGITLPDTSPADQDILQIMKPFFTQRRISRPGVLLEITRYSAPAELRLDLWEGRRDQLGDLLL